MGSQRESFTTGRRIKQTLQTSEVGATIAIGPSVRHNNSRYVSVSDKWPARGPKHATPKASHPLLRVPMPCSCQQAVALLLLTTFNPFWVKLYFSALVQYIILLCPVCSDSAKMYVCQLSRAPFFLDPPALGYCIRILLISPFPHTYQRFTYHWSPNPLIDVVSPHHSINMKCRHFLF